MKHIYRIGRKRLSDIYNITYSRYSSDNGRSWSDEFIIRDDFFTSENKDMKDLGYPRLIQNQDGDVVAIYYWATRTNPEQHLAVSVWTP